MKDPANWKPWPLAMLPLAVVGLVLASRVWNAKPQPRAAPLPVGDVIPGAVPGASSRTGTNG